MARIDSLSVGAKLAVSGIAAIALVLGVALGAVAWRLLQQARDHGQARLAESAHAVSTLLSGYDQTFRKAALRDFGIFRALYPGHFALVEAEAPDGRPAPVLRHDGAALNGEVDGVDRFTRSTGSVATVFARAGDDFVRIATSVKKEDGTRALGTLLGRASPAYADVVAGRTRVDRFPLFGAMYMHVYEPIRDGDRTIGVLYVGVPMADTLAQLATTLQAQRLFRTGALYAVDLRPGPTLGQVTGLAQPRSLAGAGPEAALFLKALQDTPAGALEQRYSVRSAGTAPVRVAYVRNEAWNWALVAEAPADELTADAASVIALFAGAVGVALLVLASVLVWLSRRLIARPVASLREALSRLAEGDLAQPLAAGARDELGALVHAMEAFRARLVEAMRVVRHNAEAVDAASERIATGNHALSGRTSSQAGALQQTAASLAQLGVSIRGSAESAAQADAMAQQASALAGEGGTVVDQVVATMRDIDASSRRIADIVGLVDGLAFQTNILALNAAVEAARAGEQGRGFAVVAAEVRSLAQRSGQAAREIKSLIAESVGQVEAGSTLVVGAGATMGRVVDAVREVSRIVQDISRAAAQERDGIGQIDQAVTQLDEVTQRNAALVEASAAATTGLREQAAALAQAVHAFRL